MRLPTAEPSAALLYAPSRTFSNTRGTPTTRLGRTRCSSTINVDVSDQCDWVAPEIVHARDTARASTCASGRKVTIRWPG